MVWAALDAPQRNSRVKLAAPATPAFSAALIYLWKIRRCSAKWSIRHSLHFCVCSKMRIAVYGMPGMPRRPWSMFGSSIRDWSAFKCLSGGENSSSPRKTEFILLPGRATVAKVDGGMQ